ncbi:MAG: penicillin-binding protein 2, partial [Deltaproteobacteria bacterium]|nr:penicillin-binding protein 2 [Deltaproteobacteria bacterium]
MQRSIRNIGTRVFQWVDRAGMGPAARAARAERRIKQIAWALGGYVVFAYSAAVVAVVNVDGVRKYAEGNVAYRSRVDTRRGDILDRHGVTLATSLRSDSVSTNPRWLLPGGAKPSHPEWGFRAPKAVAFRNEVAARLARLVDRPLEDIQERIHREVGFVYLAKNLDYAKSERVRTALINPKAPDGLPKGVTLEREFTRYYPNNLLAGPLVGRPTQTGSVEASFDALLAGQQVEVRSFKDSSSTPMFFDGAPEPGLYAGHSLVLTIDERIQAVTEHHLDAATQEFEADFGIAAVMDVDTGEVLALAVSPSLNPNDAASPPKYGWHNLALENQYEPGSTFKVFNLAIGLQEKKVSLTEVIATGAGYALPGKIIKDDHPHGQVTGLQSLQVSSNIANCKIAMRINRERYYGYLKAMGFGRRVDLGIQGESNGQLAKPDKWSTVQYCNIAFGQGIAVTPLQMTAAVAAVANGGVYRRPKILREELRPDGKPVRPFAVDPGVRVFDEATAAQVRTAMASVTRPRDPKDPHSLSGTATRARMPNYTIGGKTGTAQQAENGHYSDTHW